MLIQNLTMIHILFKNYSITLFLKSVVRRVHLCIQKGKNKDSKLYSHC